MSKTYLLITSLIVLTGAWISCKNQTKPTLEKKPQNTTTLVAPPEFSTFLENFPIGEYPLSVTDKHVTEINLKGPALSKIDVLTFICGTPISRLNCSSEDVPAAQRGPKIYNSIYPHRLFKEKGYLILLYQLSRNRFNEIYLTTYSPKGQMLSRILFAGSDEHSDLAINGKLKSDRTIDITKIQYALDLKYDLDETSIYETKTTTYRILENGKIKNLQTNQILGDEPFEHNN